MARFSNVQLTQKGLRLQAKVQAGATLTLSKVSVGDGYLPDGHDILTMTQLINKVDTPVDIIGNKVAGDGTTALEVRVQNGSTPFYFREIGIMAIDPDEGEILYAYSSSGDYADFMPSVSGTSNITQDLTLITQIGNAAEVNVNVTLVVEVTRDEFRALQSTVDENISLVSFIYKCTGDADSTAIAAIINKFFSSGTEMSMKLIVTGTMGIALPDGATTVINIIAANNRGAICHVDFSNCHIPTITVNNTDFLRIKGTARLHVDGLNVQTTRSGITLTESHGNSFSNCIIKSYCPTVENDVYSMNLDNARDNIFINCAITNTGISSRNYCVRFTNNSDGNKFIGCIMRSTNTKSYYDNYGAHINNSHENSFTDCKIETTSTSGCVDYAVYITNSEYNRFNNCKIRSVNTYKDTSSIPTAVYIVGANNSFVDCDVRSESVGGGSIRAVHLGGAGNNSFYGGSIMSDGGFTNSRAVSIYGGKNNSFYDVKISAIVGSGVGIESTFSGILILSGCVITGNSDGVNVSTSNTAAAIRLVNCAIKGYSSTYDVYQSTAPNTIKWHITGNSFAHSAIYPGDFMSSGTQSWSNDYIYMPPYANQFNCNIE